MKMPLRLRSKLAHDGGSLARRRADLEPNCWIQAQRIHLFSMTFLKAKPCFIYRDLESPANGKP